MTLTELPRRRIGRSDLMATALGLGCNNFGWRTDAETSREIVHAALDLGVNFFDTADIYGRRGGSERLLGAALGNRRKDVLIATKFGAAMTREAPAAQASPAYIARAVDDSLTRLGTDYIDLYQMHWHDPEIPIAETLGALERLREQGKILAAGCCNLGLVQVLEAMDCAAGMGLEGFVSIQAPYSAIEREIEQDLIPTLTQNNLSLIPYFPLAGGLLSGRYDHDSPAPRGRLDEFAPHKARFLSPERLHDLKQIRQSADAEGRSLLSYSLRWLYEQPAVAVIIAGASRADHVRRNFAALMD